MYEEEELHFDCGSYENNCIVVKLINDVCNHFNPASTSDCYGIRLDLDALARESERVKNTVSEIVVRFAKR